MRRLLPIFKAAPTRRVVPPSVFIFAFVIACSASDADAASSKPVRLQPLSPTINATVSLPDASSIPSEIERAERLRVNARPQAETRLEVAVSSYVPRRLELETLIPATPYGSSAIPDTRILAGYMLADPALTRGRLELRVGPGFQSLSRQGTLGTGGLAIRYDETLYWTGLHAGATWHSSALSYGRLSPYAGVSLFPSVLMTQSSAFGQGRVRAVLPVELNIGTEISISSGANPAAPSLTLGVVARGARIADSEASGLGVHAGMRISL